MSIVLCDIDGTIADLTHRLRFIQGEEKDWDGFFAACVDDEPISDVIFLLRHLEAAYEIVFVSGRSSVVRYETAQWLGDNTYFFWPNMDMHNLYMRTHGDHRPDYLVKQELLGQILSDKQITKADIAFALDDRDQVVKMWRDNGIRCLQVANGDF